MGAVEFVSIALPAVFWPLVVGLIAWWQRKPIGRLIDGVRSGRVFGQEFDAPPPDLADAAQRGASSPEVERVIASVSAGWETLPPAASESAEQTSPAGDESSVGKVPQPTTMSAAEAHFREAPELYESLTIAQRHDEFQRRSEIERVMQSAARWGARVARNRPNDVDDWEPVVRWKDDGEPEISAVSGPAVVDRHAREFAELQKAEAAHNKAVFDYAAAEIEAADATSAWESDIDPTPEVEDRVNDSNAVKLRARRHVEETEHDLDVKRRRVKGS